MHVLFLLMKAKYNRITNPTAQSYAPLEQPTEYKQDLHSPSTIHFFLTKMFFSLSSNCSTLKSCHLNHSILLSHIHFFPSCLTTFMGQWFLKPTHSKLSFFLLDFLKTQKEIRKKFNHSATLSSVYAVVHIRHSAMRMTRQNKRY